MRRATLFRMVSETFGGGGNNPENPRRGVEERARDHVRRLNEVIAEAIHEISYIPDVRQPEERARAMAEANMARGNLIIEGREALEIIGAARHMQEETGEIRHLAQLEEAAFSYSELLVIRNEYINLVGFFLDHTIALIRPQDAAAEIKEELMSLLSLKESQETVLGAGVSQFEAAQAGYMNHCEDIIRQLDEIRERFNTFPEILESLQVLKEVIERLKENILAIGQTIH